MQFVPTVQGSATALCVHTSMYWYDKIMILDVKVGTDISINTNPLSNPTFSKGPGYLIA